MQNNEIWKDIPGYENLYQVSNLGRIKRLYKRYGKCRKYIKYEPYIINGSVNDKGYKCVILSINNKHKTYKVHRLVAEAFIPNPNNLLQVNHKDENKLNNNVDNLEWCDAKYNSNYGTRIERCTSPNKKKVVQLDIDTYKIIKIYNSVVEASMEMNIKHQNISAVCRGERNKAGGFIWKYFEEEK